MGVYPSAVVTLEDVSSPRIVALDLLSTLPKPTIAAVIPLTVPVNVGDAKGAFRAIAASMAVFV
jgi:hypothetical protein